MARIVPRTNILLINEYERGLEPDLNGLLQSLQRLPGFADVVLTPRTPETVTATVSARNQNEADRLKALVNDKIDGWHVLEEQTYGLPSVF